MGGKKPEKKDPEEKAAEAAAKAQKYLVRKPAGIGCRAVPPPNSSCMPAVDP